MITLIVNPVAGNGRSKKVANSVQERLKEQNIPHRILETTAPGNAELLARRVAEEYQDGDFLLSVGGDGTFFEILQGALGTALPIAAVAAGTGNDFLKTLRIPADPMAALDHILNATPRLLDVGEINGSLFANECGAGFDVAVLDYAENAKKYCRGLLPYLWGVFCALFRHNPTPMEIVADGEIVFSGDCLVFSVANGQYIGGGIQISPEADPQSGKLELVVIKACTRPRMASYIPGLLTGKILSFKDTVVHCRADRILVRPLGKHTHFRVNIDGEIRDLPYCDFSIHPAALRVHM